MVREPFDGRAAAVSECGRRRVNQDAVLLAVLPDGSELAAVADGMGGHAGGEVASRVALATIRAALEAGADLAMAVHAANQAILAEAGAQPELLGMGTTVVAVLRRGAEYTVANVGDSRAYRIDRHGIVQLTEDHSFMAEAMRSGNLSEQQAASSQWRNAVTRAVGTENAVDVDSFGPFPIDESHALLLCSDGLYRALGEEELRRTVLSNTDPAEAVRQLTRAAYDAGSDDNISAALLIMPAGAHVDVAGVIAPDGALADARVDLPAGTDLGSAALDVRVDTPAGTDLGAPVTDAASAPAPMPPSLPAPVPASAPAAAKDAAAARADAAARSQPARSQPARKSRRRRRHPSRRWTFVQAAIIFAGVVLVILYVAMLRSVL